jgi:hypothetical protein
MSFSMPPKDPNAVLDYKFDYAPRTNGNTDVGMTDWLKTGEAIDSFTLSVNAVTSGCLPNIADSYLDDNNTSVVVWLSGGDLFMEYLVTSHIVTSSSPVARQDDRSIKIKIMNQ